MCDLDNQLKKLIDILSIALRCGNLTVDQTNLTKNVQTILVNSIRLVSSLQDLSNGGSGINSNAIPNPSPNDRRVPSIFSFLTPFTRVSCCFPFIFPTFQALHKKAPFLDHSS